MYTITDADSFLYPWVVLTLKPKQGIVLDSLPTRGGAITQEEKNRL